MHVRITEYGLRSAEQRLSLAHFPLPARCLLPVACCPSLFVIIVSPSMAIESPPPLPLLFLLLLVPTHCHARRASSLRCKAMRCLPPPPPSPPPPPPPSLHHHYHHNHDNSRRRQIGHLVANPPLTPQQKASQGHPQQPKK
ncbi:hypothetical protein IF2G_07433 [Cordyceps javanica]|nr:hypothetical protein IF2G_07433 [Cordyceps javanica]